MSEQDAERSADAVAIVGMAGRFPGAADLPAFWRNLWAGDEGVTFFSREELLAAGVDRALVENPAYVPARAGLAGIELFDAAFFGFSPREAEITNPQHRLFLEHSWHALEDAGCDPAAYPGAIGVFASASSNAYLLRISSRPDLVQPMGGYRLQIANDREFLPTWVSYKLDLKGPSINVQTACSSSLVALHIACQSLLNGECDLALAGGVSVRGLAPGGYLYQEGGILAPDGHCRTFDADAAGTVDGDGVGIVVLKRLEDALANGDNIHAVVLGSAVNNDGSAKVGYTAPSLEGQARVITEALSIAQVDPATLGYVEAHGTGTRLGDPVEISALTEAFRARTRGTGFCAVGSVKTNIGHLDAAAGVAGLIKTVLALRHRRLPPSLHFRRPNPEIDFAKTPFYVHAAPAEWTANGHPRRAGVSSFGIGGTNVHVVLEEAPPAESGPSRPWKLLVWSARTETALEAATADLARFLAETDEDLADVAHTLRGRRAFAQRRALVCRDAREAAALLERPGAQEVASSLRPARRRAVAFLFPGQGAQRPGMTLDLYHSEPVFRAEVDRCAERLRLHLGGDLRDVLYPAAAGEEAERRLLETAWAQPALFTVEWALARLWASWGVEPEALLGHSVGEYAAACVAGTLDLDGALALVAARGRLMQSLPAGAMLAVPLGEDEIRPLLEGGLSLAAVNAPRRTVVSGSLPEVEELERRLAGQGIAARRLRTSHAFHSPMMDPVLPAFAERVRAVPRKVPKIPYLSNVTGDWITPEEATDTESWVRQLRSPVRFGDAVARLLRDPDRVLVEVGPAQTLTGLVLQHPDLGEGHLAIPSLQTPAHSGAEAATLLDALGRLWAAGVDVDRGALTRGERRRRVSLPAYPFDRQRYWIAPRRTASSTNEEPRMPEPTPTKTPETSRRDAVLGVLQEIIRDLTGADPSALDPRASFLEAGVDSLLLIQATQRLQDRFGVKLSLVQLLEELTTIDRVADHLALELPAEWFPASPRNAPVPPPEPPPAAAPPAVAGPQPAPPFPPAAPASASALERVVAQQLQLMAYQLQLLQGAPASSMEPPASPATLPETLPPASPAPEPAAYARFGPYHPIEIGPQGGLTPRQQAYLDAFVRRYTARTVKSKQMTQRFRPVMADSRCSVGFRRLWKELIYPIHGARSQGSRIWDVDGNEYVDINMGFGLHFFGHSPDFVLEALERQMRTGLEVGPQSPLAGRAAELVCELTGMDRAVFCNSGTEAVMGALRAARTFTRRNKIALFSQSYHGWADPTLARAQVVDGRRIAVPAAPGVPPGTLADVLVLDYLSPQALEELEKHGEELAAVLVEPVRSRSPEVQPRDFLRQVRELTARSGTVLIFDEMVTGFRIHPGGAQAYFGIEADLATYGKLIAAGLPIGVVAGRSRFMDVLDGGMWSFGDNSYPTAEKTMMAGAFFKHPLTMAASCAVLERMRQEGPAFHERLNARTARLVADLNGDFAAAGVPIEMVCFGSLFRFRIPRELQHSDLFFYHLLEKGIFYTLESGNCFLSPAHTEEDLARLRSAVRQSLGELQDAGFLPGPPSAPPLRERREPVEETRLAAPLRSAAAPEPDLSRPVDFSLYYFGNYAAAYDPSKYELLIEGARFADAHGFAGIWLPERHFHSFGGLSPNPAVLAAALARETKHLSLRAGSAVVPLQHPIRLAEDWSLVDNLSEGRAGVSFASGWHANDFVLAPQAYGRRHEIMTEGIEKVRALWRGEPLRARDGAGTEMDIYLHPLPRQREIPVWLTASSPDTFLRAGEMGVGVLTNLQTQSLEELARKLDLYRQALVRHGHGLSAARVTLLLHTYVGSGLERVREAAAGPLRSYLRSSLHLTRRLLAGSGRDVDRLPDGDLDYLLGLAAQRYMADHALIGTPESCAAVLDTVRRLGVTEIGCLIDFGLDTPSVLEGLADLERLMRRVRASGPVSTSFREIPTTEPQQALWLASRMSPEASRAYNEPIALQLRGPLDRRALQAAFQGVVDRHGALRTVFGPEGTRQRIASSLEVRIPLIDVSGLREERQESEARTCLERLAGEPFDLERGPLLRAVAVRLGEGDHFLSITLHHLVIDGHSGGVMFHELSALYAAERRGERRDLGEALLLEDYVLRDAARRDDPALARAEAYWTGLFSDAVPRVALPTDRPRTREVRYRGGRRRLRLPADLMGRLRSLGALEKATLFTTFLASYALLLHHLTGQDDILVGVPSRDPSVTGPAVGYFINLLPLRLRRGETESFRDYLGQVRRSLLEAQEHRAYPLGRLIEKLGLSGDPEGPLVAVTFNLERLGEAPRLLGLESELVRVHQGATRVDLHLNVFEDGAAGVLELSYRSGLLDATTTDRWLRQLEILLHAIAGRPEASLRALPALPPEQLHHLLVEWNDNRDGGAPPACLHELFERQAARRPTAVALVMDGETLSYGELDRRASRLAGCLASLGVGPEVCVGLCVDRSFDMIAGLLAVLKAGGAYLPLEPSTPRERLLSLIADARISLVLSQRHLDLEEPLAAAGARVLSLDGDLPLAKEPGLRRSAERDNLAYVIYTSGSTGRPNGIMVPHRGAVNLLRLARDLYGVGPDSRVLQMLSLGFDASVLEIFLALGSGGSLCLAPEEERRTPSRIAETIRRQGITTAVLTPSVLSVLPPEPVASVRSLSVGGEVCTADLVARWAPGRRLLNCYGPTEATIFATVEICTERPGPGGASPPIGRAVANVQTYVVDRELRPVPLGAPGELLLGGEGLARGYLDRPQKTAERFVPHPFAALQGTPGARLYRTGDLVRLRPDGRIDFLGRLDTQVKVRGFRIELGEVEAALAELAGVREAAVGVRGEREGQRLVAWVVPEAGWRGRLVPELRQRLRARLPDYMVPASWVELAAPLPRTASGKLDRRSLPAPDEERGAGSERPPRTPLESFLVELWREILHIERIGLHDDFFALGGNSITGAKLVNRLQEALGEIVHVVVMFDAPTTAKLAHYLGQHYPGTVARLWGEESLPETRRAALPEAAGCIDEARVEELRRAIVPLAPRRQPAGPKNPRVVFVLSPPRSGSTLLRVMLGGHPGLFSPPELELLSFHTLDERRKAFTGRHGYWLEGATRAVMEILGCGAEVAEEAIAACEREVGTTRELYRRMQEWIGERRLVDKTPSYALDPAILRRAEEEFEESLYIHLVRHPCGMICSFEEARLEQVFFRHAHTFGRRELAELIWVVSQQNILRFLEEIPEPRRHRVHFEHLVREPRAVLEGICAFLGLDHHPDMLEPYKEKRKRMTDGIHSWSRMLGDVKFHQHSAVDPRMAERWSERLSEDGLGEVTRELARALGCATERSVERRTRVSLAPIVPLPREPGRPLLLSFAQQRLWFLDRLGIASSTYNLPMAVRLRGSLDPAALSAALGEVVRRHKVLRTTFAEVEGEPRQVIAPPGPFPLPLADLAGLGEPERSREAGRLAEEMARRPFDLARGPLLRSALVRVDEREHLALLTMHHIVSDGWSIGILIRELAALYAAFAEGRPSPLPDLGIQYVDFAAWQRQRLAGAAMEASLDYWRGRLGGAPVLDLPTDRPRPPFPALRGAQRSFAVSADRAARLRELSQRWSATLFMTLLAAFQTLLARASGQGSVAVGTPVAGRNHAQTEDLIGFFVNTLVLRTDLSGDPSLEELVVRTREVVLGAYAHQDLPFEKVVEALQPARSLSHSPLFQVMLVFQNLPGEPLRLPGLTLAPVGVENRSAKLDLTLMIADAGGSLAGTFEYNTDLFYASTMQRLENHFAAVLEGFARDPRARISELPLLNPAERAQVLREWNDTAAAPARGALVHEAVAGWAERMPDAPALLFEGATISYRDLQCRADRLAAFLRASGVELEDRVGVCLEPSPEMIVALLGILQAGGAYVPLDPGHPAERRTWMLEDAGVEILLTREIGAAGTPEVVSVDAANAAYVIYTSGSTGRPKGVVATHGGLASFTRAMGEAMALGPGDRVLQFASLAFDASAVQIFPTLTRGATLVLHPNPRGLSADELLDLCARTEVTVLDLPAALWRQWIADVAVSRARIEAPIRLYMTGGEAVPAAVLRGWASRMAPGIGFLSSYGPTEATVTTTAFQTTSSAVDDLRLEEVPMGRPLADVQVYVLDPRLAPVPVGVAGEVFIGGAGVTRGYLRWPAGTAERYVPDPWSGEPGGRLYRTGDLARWLADGTLQFLGRRDHQVKIRGFRIELGEIEAAIRGCPGVRDLAVVLHEDGAGERRLVACVAPEDAVELAPPAILSAVRDVLPAPLVPSHVLTFSELPLTAGGKVDRRELARRVDEMLRTPALLREVVLPRTQAELQLAQLWEELLDVRPVGVRDDFFELGGHSLLAVRLVARIKARLGQELPLAALFEEPTVEHLARRLEAAHGRAAWSSLVPIQPKGSRAPFFCVHPLGGGVVGYRALVGHLGPDQPFYALQAPSLDAVQADAPHASIEEMASAYLAEIRRVQPNGPYLLGGASFGGVVAFEMAQQVRRIGERVEILALFDSPVPQGSTEDREIDLAAAAVTLAREQARQGGKHLELTDDDLQDLSLEEKLGRILEGLRELGVVGIEIDVPLFLQFLQGLQARLNAVERYHAKSYPGRVHLFRPLELDPESLRLATAERLKILEDPALGWGKLAAAGVEVYKVPGYHDTMLSEPYVRDLAKLLDICISQQLGASPEPDVL